jgi:hypothetical protein
MMVVANDEVKVTSRWQLVAQQPRQYELGMGNRLERRRQAKDEDFKPTAFLLERAIRRVG